MVKLELEINEIVGLAELGKIKEKQLQKFLKAASKEELENYIVSSTLGEDTDISAEPDESGEGKETEEIKDL